MKVNYSISLKLTLMVVLLSTIIILSSSYINFQMLTDQETIYQSQKIDKWAARNFADTHAVLETLDRNMSDSEKFNDTTNLTKMLIDISNSNYFEDTEITQININTMVEESLITTVSTDDNSIGLSPGSYEYNDLSYTNGDTYYIIDPNEPILTIISPVNISGEIVGTYELIVYMHFESLSLETQIQYMVIIATISIFILIFSFLFLLRRSIVKPIIKFRDAAEVIGTGNLDAKIDIDSRDELGELANAFNQMAKDLKESRDKVEDYNIILENLLDRKDEFIGQLGHDLKNPLQPLIGLLPTLIEKEKDPDIKEALELMNRNAEYMKDLIYNTLQLAKLRSETIEFDIEDLNLRQESDDVIETQKLFLKERDITIENKIGKKIVVRADKLRLSEVFKNLITNSIKYTAEGGGKITLDAKQDKTMVTVSVKDTGIGMTQEQISKIFDEFYKADKASSEYASTGLGLAICKRIVEKHDGKIWVESMGHGKGSTFYFTLKSKAKNN